ncbi:hypothetical protein MTES_0489 [Microbacterium testaceum StLB037]|uniref:Uncharacterized protein n=1 Tax=Microbacterium testaceum (strain StLB037) TaxID=979556 RepID=E8NBJ3_MICTS|nr:hypothetical protein MTES_0489 [Microbacterium testaceum StLB037]
MCRLEEHRPREHRDAVELARLAHHPVDGVEVGGIQNGIRLDDRGVPGRGQDTVSRIAESRRGRTPDVAGGRDEEEGRHAAIMAPPDIGERGLDNLVSRW